MNLEDFLNSVRPGLQPDLPIERQQALLAGGEPIDFDEEVWCEWNTDRIDN